MTKKRTRRRGVCTRDYWGSRRRDSSGRFVSPRSAVCGRKKPNRILKKGGRKRR